MADLVYLKTFYDAEEALVAASALRAAGFSVSFEGENHLSTNPGLRIALHGYRLQAPADQAEAVKAMLVEFDTAEPQLPIGADTPCPNCGGMRLRRKRNLVSGVVGLILGAPFAKSDGVAICTACGEHVGTAASPAWPWIILTALALVIIALQIF